MLLTEIISKLKRIIIRTGIIGMVTLFAVYNFNLQLILFREKSHIMEFFPTVLEIST